MKSKQEIVNCEDVTSIDPIIQKLNKVPQLNDYCLDHIAKYLEAGDVINFWLTNIRFRFAITRRIRHKLFDLAELNLCGFHSDAVKEFLSVNQREIRRLGFSHLKSSEELVDFEFLLVNCHDVEEINLNITAKENEEINLNITAKDNVDRETVGRFLAEQKHLRKLKIIGAYNDAMEIIETVATHCPELEEIEIRIQNHEDSIEETSAYNFISQMQKLRVFKIDSFVGDRLAREIAKIKNLSVLHMTSCPVTGRHLTTLQKLKELNLNGCYRLQVHHLNEILRVNIDLKKLNIAYCCIKSRAFSRSAATQNNLEWIELNSCFYTSFDVPRLKSLRHVRIYEIARSIPRLERFLKHLSNHHRNRIETLEIYNRSLALETNDCEIVPSFQNLKRLALRGVKGVDDIFLKEVSKACKKLEAVDLWDSGAGITANGLVAFIHVLKQLKCLKISKFNYFNETLYRQLVETLKTDVWPKHPLKIYLSNADFNEECLQTKEYSESKKFVEVIFDRDNLVDFF